MPVAKLSEVDLYYELYGPEGARVIVLSNSLGTNLSMWDAQVVALAPAFRVLRYDTRGHGRSSAPAGTYSLQQLGSDVMELLDWLAIEKVLVCGISLGGMTALWLASHLGGRIRGIIAANTAARIGSVTSWNERIALVESEGMDALARIVPQRWLTARFRSGHPEVVRACEAMVRATPAQGYIGCCSAIRDMDLSHDLNKIDVPVLIISGKHDQMTTTADAQILGKQIAGALHVQLSAAHLSNLECATEFNAAVMEFLRSETER